MRLASRLCAALLAAMLVAWPVAAYAAGQRAASGDGSSGKALLEAGQGEASRSEARSGWDQTPPSGTAEPDRDRVCDEDRLQDGSCDACVPEGCQLQARKRGDSSTGMTSAAALESESAGDDDSDGAMLRERMRNRVAVQTLERVEMRLRQLDAQNQGEAPGLVVAALRIAERVRLWLAGL